MIGKVKQGYLLLLHMVTLIVIVAKSNVRKTYDWQWTVGGSDKLQSWYSPLELCILDNDSNSSGMLSIKTDCLKQNPTFVDDIPGFTCKAGGAAKVKGSCRAPNEHSMRSHFYLQRAVRGYDNASQNFLGMFAERLVKYNISVDVFGDSVSSNALRLATSCELERKNVSLALFRDDVDSSVTRGIQFHLHKILELNGISKTMETRLGRYESIMIILNT